jgi:Protein of unknown function (DUF2568)
VDTRPSGPTAVLLGLRFAAELGLLAACGWGGWGLVPSPWSVVTAVVLPVGAALLWSRWVAPRSTHRLGDPARAALELVLFGAAFVLLTRAEPHPATTGWALALVAAYLVSMPARRVDL